jgi:peroxin-2
MRLVPARKLIKRNVSYEFMNRQMVWHAFTVSNAHFHLCLDLTRILQEFLLFLLPLVNTRGIRKRFSRLVSQTKLVIISSLPARLRVASGDKVDGESVPRQRGKYWALSEDQCAICAENASYNLNFADSTNALTSFAASASNVPSGHDDTDTNEPPMYPITTPYITSCGHIYCYYCIAERMLRVADDGDGQGWECLRCSQTVKDADRLEMEVEESADFSSDNDLSEMSGSLSSYTGSSE